MRVPKELLKIQNEMALILSSERFPRLKERQRTYYTGYKNAIDRAVKILRKETKSLDTPQTKGE